MTKYLVKRPWHGVSKGDVIETDKLHPALLPNVEVFIEQAEELEEPAKEELKLEVATPKAKTKGK